MIYSEFKIWVAFFSWTLDDRWANITFGYLRPQIGRESITSAFKVSSFEKGLTCVTARYTLKPNGKVKVLNRGFSARKGKYKSSIGRAWVPDDNYPGRLKVSFFWPFAGNYYIISLGHEYSYALVGDPSREYLWVLSRTKKLDETIYDELLATARSLGFNADQMVRVQHNCE